MKTKTALLVAVLLMFVSAIAVPTQADTGAKFGPWRYFAPYYFPRSGCCDGICFTPEDFIPKYEDPPPPAPANAMAMPSPPPPTCAPQKVRQPTAPAAVHKAPDPFRSSPRLTPHRPMDSHAPAPQPPQGRVTRGLTNEEGSVPGPAPARVRSPHWGRP